MIVVCRAASVFLGLFLLWAALASPLAGYDHHLLTFHMVSHLVLMTVAPALILLGAPSPNCEGVRPLRGLAHVLHPAVCWTVSSLTLVVWHIPDVFTLAMRSDAWHVVEQSSFVVAGFLFWWPVIRPWPSIANGPQWSTLMYLFLATLPCDVLAGFLLFSERVAYPIYNSMPRHFGLSVMEDQQCAAALMWTTVTVVYLVPAAILSTRLLSPRSVDVAPRPRPRSRDIQGHLTVSRYHRAMDAQPRDVLQSLYRRSH